MKLCFGTQLKRKFTLHSCWLTARGVAKLTSLSFHPGKVNSPTNGGSNQSLCFRYERDKNFNLIGARGRLIMKITHVIYGGCLAEGFHFEAIPV